MNGYPFLFKLLGGDLQPKRHNKTGDSQETKGPSENIKIARTASSLPGIQKKTLGLPLSSSQGWSGLDLPATCCENAFHVHGGWLPTKSGACNLYNCSPAYPGTQGFIVGLDARVYTRHSCFLGWGTLRVLGEPTLCFSDQVVGTSMWSGRAHHCTSSPYSDWSRLNTDPAGQSVFSVPAWKP